MSKNILVTGAAGFIGMHLVIELINKGYNVFGIDTINDYYDINLKYARLLNCGISETNTCNNEFVQSKNFLNYYFSKVNLTNKKAVEEVFSNQKIDMVIHLAAQAGVRYSINNPDTYIENNLNGFFNIIDAARKSGIKKFIYASSSSVYGNSDVTPFDEEMNVDRPVSLYAATKKCNELIAHSYSEIYNIQTIGLRFFTVYGPWGRPDMAYFSFTKAIFSGEEIKIYNNGELSRDFTYIDDIVDGICELVNINLNKKYLIFNIGNDNPEKLMDFVNIIEAEVGKPANIKFVEMQKGDVEKTWANINSLSQTSGYRPKTNLQSGIHSFVKWYKEYYKK